MPITSPMLQPSKHLRVHFRVTLCKDSIYSNPKSMLDIPLAFVISVVTFFVLYPSLNREIYNEVSITQQYPSKK